MLTHDDNLRDRWLTDALTSAAARQEKHFLAALLADAPKAAKACVPFDGPARGIIAIVASLGSLTPASRPVAVRVLLTNVIDPNRRVEGNFRVYTVVMAVTVEGP